MPGARAKSSRRHRVRAADTGERAAVPFFLPLLLARANGRPAKQTGGRGGEGGRRVEPEPPIISRRNQNANEY
jgi:hypothetical protein